MNHLFDYKKSSAGSYYYFNSDKKEREQYFQLAFVQNYVKIIYFKIKIKKQ